MKLPNVLQKKLMRIQKPIRVVYVGDVGVDIYGKSMYPGGCGLNVAYWGHQLGLSVDLVSCVGTDAPACIPVEVLKKLALPDSRVRVLSGDTPNQKITVTASGEKEFASYSSGVLEQYKLDQNDINYIQKHQVLLTIYYKQFSHIFHIVTRTQFSGIKLVDFMDLADAGKRASFVQTYSDWFDIGFFGLSIQDKSLIGDLIHLAKLKNKLFVITLGKDGSLGIWNDKIYKLKAVKVPLIDTTGCGDAYIAGFVSDFLNTGNVISAMKVGNKLSAKVAQNFGAIPVINRV